MTGTAPVVVDTANINHFYDRRHGSTYRVLGTDGPWKVVKFEDVADDGLDEDGKLKPPYTLERMSDGKLRVKEPQFRIQYDDVPDTPDSSESEEDLGQRADDGRQVNKVAEALRKASKGTSQSE